MEEASHATTKKAKYIRVRMKEKSPCLGVASSQDVSSLFEGIVTKEKKFSNRTPKSSGVPSLREDESTNVELPQHLLDVEEMLEDLEAELSSEERFAEIVLSRIIFDQYRASCFYYPLSLLPNLLIFVLSASSSTWSTLEPRYGRI